LEVYRAIAMAAAWLVNLGVAELVIRRRARSRVRGREAGMRARAESVGSAR
jgi:hypothetical protein